MAKRAFLLGLLGAIGCFGQVTPPFYPAGAHVNLYFPHLADGGDVSVEWQTSLEFVNPSSTLTAHVQLSLFGDLGFPLTLDFGTGAGSQAIHTFSIPPGGTITLRSTIASDKTVTGRATAVSDIPVTGTVLFRYISNGSVFLEVSAPPTLPTSRYTSLANRDLGIALANISGVARVYQVAAVNSSGTTVGTATVSIAGLGHQSFNLWQVLPNLAADFTGSVVITPQVPGDQILAWTLNADRASTTILPTGIISTLPSGAQDWPVSHPDRIQLVFNRLLAAAPSLLAPLGNNLSLQTAPNLVVSSAAEVNAFANSNQTVQINSALSELVSDSPSELAFLVAHELAHIAQSRGGAFTVLLPHDLANKEPDADLMAMILVLSAGFDPYGAAGAIGKLNMAYTSSGLVSPFFDGLSDATAAFSPARMNSMLGLITTACTSYVTGGYCATFKTAVHPHFPASAPQ